MLVWQHRAVLGKASRHPLTAQLLGNRDVAAGAPDLCCFLTVPCEHRHKRGSKCGSIASREAMVGALRTAKPEYVVARRKVLGNHNVVDKRCGSQVTRAVALHVDPPAVGAASAVPGHPMRRPNLLLAGRFELPTLKPHCCAVAGLEVRRLPRRRRVEIDTRDRIHLPNRPRGRGAL